MSGHSPPLLIEIDSDHAEPPAITEYRCTFTNCPMVFESEDGMRRHKKTSVEHGYCKVCDEDFVDEAGLQQHKVDSDKHMVCHLCSAEFATESAQLYHIESQHPTDQEISCACREQFTRAGGLMAHIERGQCPRISVRQFQALRARKILIRDFLADPEKFRLPDMYEPMVAGGHVHLLDSLVDEGGEDVGVFDIPVLNPSEPNLAPRPEQREDEEEMLIPDAAIPEQATTAAVAPAATGLELQLLVPVPAAHAPPAKKKSLPAQCDPKSSSFDLQKFKNPITLKFVCPLPFCRGTFSTMTAFKRHLASDAHADAKIDCPSCFKSFKTITALVQHCESPSTHCLIRKYDDYNQTLDVITGGLVEVAGTHPDGSVKYDAGKIAW